MREIDDILLHRPALGALVDEVSEFREILASSTQQRVTGASPLTPAELRLLPYLQTHLTIRESGSACSSPVTLSARRSARSTGLGVSSRNEAVQQATAIGLLGG
jgi:LuxR family maltose regulon positive regulatory protein